MPRRSFTVMHLQCHQRHYPARKFDLADLPDHADLLHRVHGLVHNVDRSRLRRDERERYAAIDAVAPKGRTLLITMSVGDYGAQGTTTNVNTHQITHRHDAEEAHTLPARLLLAVPQRGASALLFNEHVGQRSPGSDLVELLRLAFRENYPDVTLSCENLVRGNAWLEHGQLEEVSAVLHDWSADIADSGEARPIGNLHHTLRPPKGQRFLPATLWERLRTRQLRRGALLGLREGEEPEEVTVRLENEGQQKTFVLGRERTPAIRYLMSDYGEPALSSEEFREVCLEQALELFRSVGADWQTSWCSGEWSEEALRVAFPLPAREAPSE